LGGIKLNEKRAYPRTPLTEDIKYAHGIKAKAKDISLSGIRFWSARPIKSKAAFNLYFILAGKCMVKTIGNLIWSRDLNDQMHEHGFCFQTINKEGEVALSEYINRQLHELNIKRIHKQFLIDVLINCSIQAKAKIVTITDDGMSLFTPSPLGEKKMILVSIPLPAGDTIDIHGKSVWSKQLHANLFENSIQFWNIDHLQKQKLDMVRIT
jgi:hypothetical protein